MDIRTPVERFNHAEQYDREEYAEKSNVFTFDHQDVSKLTYAGTPVLEEAVHKKGRPKILWLGEHNLGPSAHPVEWLDVVLLRKQHSYKRKKNKKKEKVSIMSDWKNYTNLKASLCHAGIKINFTTKEL